MSALCLVVCVAELPEMILQVMLALMIVAWLAFGGEKFESDYEPSQKWIVGANWFKRGFSKKTESPRSHH